MATAVRTGKCHTAPHYTVTHVSCYVIRPSKYRPNHSEEDADTLDVRAVAAHAPAPGLTALSPSVALAGSPAASCARLPPQQPVLRMPAHTGWCDSHALHPRQAQPGRRLSL